MNASAKARMPRAAGPLSKIIAASLAVPAAALTWLLSAAQGASLGTAGVRAAGGAAIVYLATRIATRLLLGSILATWNAENGGQSERR